VSHSSVSATAKVTRPIAIHSELSTMKLRSTRTRPSP